MWKILNLSYFQKKTVFQLCNLIQETGENVSLCVGEKQKFNSKWEVQELCQKLSMASFQIIKSCT